jgi:ATP-binding cassette, subfamily B, bacterial
VIPRLRALRRVLVIVFGTGFRVAPKKMTMAVTTTVVVAALSVGYTIGFRIVVNAIAAHDRDRALVGVAVVAGLFAAQWGLAVYVTLLNNTVRDLCDLYLSARIAEMVNAIPGIEHFERPEYLRELDLLEQNRLLIANGPRQALELIQVIARSLTIVVLMGTVYPPLIALPLLGIFPFLCDGHAARLRDRTDEELSEKRRLASDFLRLASTASTASELRTFGLTEEIKDRHQAINAEVRRQKVRVALKGSLWSAGGWFLCGAGFVAAIVVLVARAVHGQASAGDVVLIVSLLRRAQQQVSQFSSSLGQVVNSGRASRHYFWLEDRAAEVARAMVGRTAPPPQLNEGITLSHVSFTYPGTETPVLKDVCLLLPAGGTVAIVGENGAGKSTLIKLLTAMYLPTSGSILVDGDDLALIDTEQWRARTTAGFQDFVKFQLNAGQVVGIGDLPRMDSVDAIDTALERAEASDVIASLGGGLATPLGWSMVGGQDLSGGQWQKLALGRTMMRDEPLLLVLDEPTASLDAPTESALFDRYVGAAGRGATASGAVTILVSHRFSTVRSANLIVVIGDGEVCEVGGHDELMAAGGLYAELFELQARSYR